MTVKELIGKLSTFPSDMQVMIPSVDLEFNYGFVESVHSQEIKFHEGTESSDAVAYEECVIIDEEQIWKH